VSASVASSLHSAVISLLVASWLVAPAGNTTFPPRVWRPGVWFGFGLGA